MLGETLLIRLWETLTEKGIGGWLSPWQTRRTGRAETDVLRERALAVAQTENDVKDILSGSKQLTPDYRLIEGPASSDGTVTRDESHSGVLAAEAHRNLIAEQMRAEVNVAKAALIAEANLEGDQQAPPDRRVGEDWLFRWRDLAGRTSSETLQSLWGSVLAGEVKSPGSFSLRTLDFLKSLSQEEAKQVERLAPFVIQKEFVAYDPPASGVLESQGIDYGFLKSLADLGVVSSARRGASRSIPSQQPDRFETGLIAYRRVLVVRHEDAKKTVNLGAYAVTPIGREVLGLGAFQPNEAHLRGVGEAIKRQGFEVLLARWTQLTETSGQYSDPEEL